MASRSMVHAVNALDRTLLGLTREQVLERIGTPDDVGLTSRRHKAPQLWLYGTVEVCFGKDGLVDLIFDDDEKGGSGKSFVRAREVR